jgi:hypothetical protein
MPRGRGPRRSSPEAGLPPPQTVEELRGAIEIAREDVEELERLAELTDFEWIYVLLTGTAERRRANVSKYRRQLRNMGEPFGD